MNNGQLIADLRREIEQLRSALRDIVDHQERPWNHVDAPGHGHKIPGVWDTTGTKCEWCAKWNKARSMIS